MVATAIPIGRRDWGVNEMRMTKIPLLLMLTTAFNVVAQAAVPIVGQSFDISETVSDRDFPATEALWAAEELTLRNVTIENSADVTAYAPRIVITGDFRAQAGSVFRAGVPVFKVRVINMVDPDPTAPKAPPVAPAEVIAGQGIDFSDTTMSQEAFERFCQNEIAILNYYFKSDDGRQLVKFQMADALLWNDTMIGTSFYQCTSAGSNEDDCPATYPGSGHLEAFNDSDFDPYRDDHAINLIFFDDPDGDTSGGNPNVLFDGPPMVLIDYQRVDENLGHDCDGDGRVDDCGINAYCNRIPPAPLTCVYCDPTNPYCHADHRHIGSLNNGIQDDDHSRRGVEPHEMGHAFGLHHSCRQHPYNPTTHGLWDNLMWSHHGLHRTQTGFSDCLAHCDDDPSTVLSDCQQWFRTSFFAKEALNSNDGGFKYIQSYMRDIDYQEDFWTYGQAAIIMNMAYHFKQFLH